VTRNRNRIEMDAFDMGTVTCTYLEILESRPPRNINIPARPRHGTILVNRRVLCFWSSHAYISLIINTRTQRTWVSLVTRIESFCRSAFAALSADTCTCKGIGVKNLRGVNVKTDVSNATGSNLVYGS